MYGEMNKTITLSMAQNAVQDLRLPVTAASCTVCAAVVLLRAQPL